MPRYLTEFVGTFFLVLIIGLTVVPGSPLAPLAIGLGLAALVFMGGPISGAHYNPAVSVALRLQGALPSKDFIPYLVAQVTGGLLAALAVFHILGASFMPAPSADAGMVSILLVEFFFTFMLVLVILNVAVSDAVQGNSYYGLAIGLTIAAGAAAGGPISGGAFNPAVGLGPALAGVLTGAGFPAHVWMYLVAPVAGGLAAVPVYSIMQSGQGAPPTTD